MDCASVEYEVDMSQYVNSAVGSKGIVVACKEPIELLTNSGRASTAHGDALARRVRCGAPVQCFRFLTH
jgi:hypothetical protein